MSRESPYQIIEFVSRGKIAVATRDLMPGDLVLSERKPILFVDFAAANKIDKRIDHMTSVSIVGYLKYKHELKPGAQARFMNLYQPPTVEDAGLDRKNFKTLIAMGFPFEHGDDETYFRVCRVMKFNMFIDPENEGYAVYGEVTQLRHSCAPNCAHSIGTECTCFAISHIKEGEELTMSYGEDENIKHTHDRRFFYLEHKEFTCHCPRCDALGDDTRQFDCSDPACNGAMIACQPIQTEGCKKVEYLKPHLLPCTECQMIPSEQYQAEMFALEREAPRLVETLDKNYSRATSSSDDSTLEQLLPKIPRHHTAFLEILEINVLLQNLLARSSTSASRAAVQAAVARYFAAFEGPVPLPDTARCTALCSVAVLHILPPREQLALCQRSKRLVCLLFGRTSQKAHQRLDDALVRALAAAGSPSAPPNVCALCGESPEHVAITLSRCGRCKQMCYCSAGCQKVHWKLHKKVCKPAK